LIEAANRAANGGDRFVEIQQGYMAFYFDHSYALAKFIKFTGDHGFDLVIEPSSSGALDVKKETKTSLDLRSTSARQGDRRVGNAKAAPYSIIQAATAS
jgi:hypothetical protein